jgi:hypothetical protein
MQQLAAVGIVGCQNRQALHLAVAAYRRLPAALQARKLRVSRQVPLAPCSAVSQALVPADQSNLRESCDFELAIRSIWVHPAARSDPYAVQQAAGQQLHRSLHLRAWQRQLERLWELEFASLSDAEQDSEQHAAAGDEPSVGRQQSQPRRKRQQQSPQQGAAEPSMRGRRQRGDEPRRHCRGRPLQGGLPSSNMGGKPWAARHAVLPPELQVSCAVAVLVVLPAVHLKHELGA